MEPAARLRETLTLSLAAAVAAVALGAAPASAHDMWANVFAETDAESTTSVVTSVGWGHSPRPVSEFIAGSRLSGYDVIAPDGTAMALPYDASANTDLDLLVEVGAVPGLAVLQGGDAFVRRLIFEDGTAEGAWRVHTGVPARVTTVWVNSAGESFSEPRFVDEITGAARIVSSVATTRAASAYWTRGGWSDPVPADVTFELLPQSDPSAARPGDTITFQLHRDGAPAEGLEGAIFAAIGPDGGEIDGTIGPDGTASITVTDPGFWVVRSIHVEPADEAGAAFADFAGRVEGIRFIATVAFDIAP